ncbi:hypothetical protein B2J93_2551 [Marssonina coronariae]|uniref:RecA family profile 1 domain-containing protein n=1 Tax=Diplocarpon coronariae TaxID=2795749 RepID=A0A218YYY1_9HELO|nr:hypothetical protein B2J93_2551 [Marssonina coronariae]
MSEAKRKILGLFRSRSAAEKPQDASRTYTDREEAERTHRRERPSTAHSSRHRPRPQSSHVSRSKSSPSSRRPSGVYLGSPMGASPSPATAPKPLTEWPPPRYMRHETLSQARALELIASGAPVFKGIRRSIPHAADDYYHLYAACEGNGGIGTDRGEVYTEAFAAYSLKLLGTRHPDHPWETLEQPSMAFCYGASPGTTTLNQWVSLSGKINPALELRDPGIIPREVELSTILERLIFLERGFEEEYEDLMYKNLYRNLLRDPDRLLHPHRAMEKQISDLIMVLSRKEWIDFSRLENQVVAKFFANAKYTEDGRYKLFFHQLLLSMELYLRIQSKQHSEYAKAKLVAQLPPCIMWDLALARRWKECMSIEKFESGRNPETIRFHLLSKKVQVKALRKFARAMKWPNLSRVDGVLKERDADATPLEDRSSDAMSYFTGVILPGSTLPWLIMNSLIDCDGDAGGNVLAALTHMHPHSGFQYGGQTYWSSTSIVGKVLAPTCREIGGWIGPSRPAPDLLRIQIARIRQRRPKQRLTVSDVGSMTERSDCLGPPSDRYPVSEYQLILPENDPYLVVNTIRIEKLALKSVSPSPASTSLSRSTSHSRYKDKPVTYDAAVQFAIDGKSWPLRLSYDVSFISAYPCSRGPHPLFFDYVYKAVKIDELLTVRDWGGLNMNINPGSNRGSPLREAGEGGADDEEEDEETVLTVEAFGVADNEVLARAWCSHWGLSAIIADIERTCAVLDALQESLGVKENGGATQEHSLLRLSGEDLVNSWNTISTLDDDLDHALGGGIPTGHITEVAGESGAGKTQFLLTLLLAAQLPAPHGLSSSALYISTEGALPTRRLAQILCSHPVLIAADPKPTLDSIISIVTPDLESQDHILRFQVPVAVRRHSIRLIILDSVAANYRAEFGPPGAGVAQVHTGGASMAQRSSELVKLGQLLRGLAREHNLAIVVANQVADRFSGGIGGSGPILRRTTRSSPLARRSGQGGTTPDSSTPTPSTPAGSEFGTTPFMSTADPMLLDHQHRWFTGWGDEPSPSHLAMESLKTPSLGMIWTTQISCRIALVKRPVYGPGLVGDSEDERGEPVIRKWRRWMKVVFAPHAAPSGPGVRDAVEFVIRGEGLASTKQKEKGHSDEYVDQF